jgi:hypothetical protein
MLDIWRPLPQKTASSVAAIHLRETQEVLTDLLSVEECELQPYPNRKFVRLIFGERSGAVDRIGADEPNNEGTSVRKSCAYALIQNDDEGNATELIPLNPSAAELYAINRILGLKLTRHSVLLYLVVFGMVIKAGDQGSFYIISNLTHILGRKKPGPEESPSSFEILVRAFFTIREEGRIEIDVKSKSYPGLGTAFSLKLPIVFENRAYLTEVRISESGVTTMDTDDSTAIVWSGLKEMPRKSLRVAPTLALKILKSDGAHHFWKACTLIFLAGERAISLLLLVPYVCAMALVLLMGFSNSGIHRFYNELASIPLLNWGALFLGSFLVFGLTLRFVLVQISQFNTKKVPGGSEWFSETVETHVKEAAKKFGLVTFTLIALLEFGSAALIATNIFIYGLGNTFWPMHGTGLNFIEALLLIVLSVPLLGPSIGWVFHIGDQIGLYSVYREGILMYLASTIIVTISIGWAIKLVRVRLKAG